MMKALIVEDSDDSRELLSRWLRRDFKFTVVESEDGEDGFEKALSMRPEVIFLDLMMPKLSGIEMLRKLRSNADIGDTPVVVISARKDSETVKEAIALGVSAYLLKPVSLAELRAHMGPLLDKIGRSASSTSNR